MTGCRAGRWGWRTWPAILRLFAELAKRGYSQVELEMIASRNILRVLREAEEYARSVADQPPIETLIAAGN
jgi:membrane dipeptidase